MFTQLSTITLEKLHFSIKFNKGLLLPVTATQWAQPAAALTIEASVGRGKGSGISLTSAIEKHVGKFQSETIK